MYSAMGLTRLRGMMILKILANTIKALSIIGAQKSGLFTNPNMCCELKRSALRKDG